MAGESTEAELVRLSEALADAEHRRAADHERASVLRGELQHRVRNALALVRSVFARSVASGGTIEELADHFSGRLDVLARYQLSRTHEPGGSVDLEMMVRDELHSFHSGGDERIGIQGAEVRLGHDVAQAMGLALHELATNSIKFGVLGNADARGQLHIRWDVVERGIDFRWEEQGVPVVAPAPLRTGFGREFIEQGLPYQLGAETSFVLRPGGLCCSILLPPGVSPARIGAKS